jgi:hypothetical protein
MSQAHNECTGCHHSQLGIVESALAKVRKSLIETDETMRIDMLKKKSTISAACFKEEL